MKWRLYLLCCLYNMMAAAGIAFYGIYDDVKRLSFDAVEIFVFGVLIICFVKNMMGYQLYTSLNRKAPRDRSFYYVFYVSWAINLCLVIFLFYGAFRFIDEASVYPIQRSAEDILITFVLLSITLTMAYAVVFDLPLSKKNKREVEGFHDLLSEQADEAGPG